MSKKILLTLSNDLYDRFRRSSYVKESSTDAEAIRTVIKYALGRNENADREKEEDS